MNFINFHKNQANKSMVYTNLCINLITGSWTMNIGFSLAITCIKIHGKIKEYFAKKNKVTQVTKITEVKANDNKESLKVE